MENEIGKILQRVISLEERVKKLEQDKNLPAISSEGGLRKKMSLKEFLLSKKQTDDVKKTLVIGYYLEKFEGFTSFNIQDLEVAFERAKEKKPLNMNDKINMNIKKGLMEEVSEKKNGRKAWHLTNSGEAAVENDGKIK